MSHRLHSRSETLRPPGSNRAASFSGIWNDAMLPAKRRGAQQGRATGSGTPDSLQHGRGLLVSTPAAVAAAPRHRAPPTHPHTHTPPPPPTHTPPPPAATTPCSLLGDALRRVDTILDAAAKGLLLLAAAAAAAAAPPLSAELARSRDEPLPLLLARLAAWVNWLHRPSTGTAEQAKEGQGKARRGG